MRVCNKQNKVTYTHGGSTAATPSLVSGVTENIINEI